MQNQVEEDRTRARNLLHLSQEIIRLKLKFENEFSSFNNNEFSLETISNLRQLKQRIVEDFDIERDRFETFEKDLEIAKEHFDEYFSRHPEQNSSAEKLDEYLLKIDRDLPRTMIKINSNRCQLETTLNLIDEILLLEEILDEKLPLVPNCLETYEDLIPEPIDEVSSIIHQHCQTKLKFYRKSLEQRHVLFDRSININNNNSSTPPEPFPPKSTTNSFISDDCKVLYIETVIEVPQRVVYERTKVLPKEKTRRLPGFFSSLFVGLFILLLLFFVYFSHLDRCSRTRILVTTFEFFIRVESPRFPTI